MFTGLVGATGVLAGRTARGPGARLVVHEDDHLAGSHVGDRACDALGEPGIDGAAGGHSG